MRKVIPLLIIIILLLSVSSVIAGTVTVNLDAPDPIITSVWNNVTEDSSTSFSIYEDNGTEFKVEANQTIDAWYWSGIDSYAGDATNKSTATKYFDSDGDYTVSVYGENENGTTSTISWSVSVSAVGAKVTPTPTPTPTEEEVGPAPMKPMPPIPLYVLVMILLLSILALLWYYTPTKDFFEVLAYIILIGFTAVILVMAILGRGAFVYYYEQNTVLWLLEIGLGIIGVGVGLYKLLEVLSNNRVRAW